MAGPSTGEGPQVAIFAGESSGDVQGAALIRAMRERAPGLTAWGIGGPAMRDAGVQVEFDSRHWGAIGVFEAFKVGWSLTLPHAGALEMLAGRMPDLVIVVDFGAFNKYLVRRADELGLKVMWYFPPGSWSRRARVGRELRECTDAVATPFPWSAELLREAGVNAHFLGHPLLDLARPREGRDEFRARYGIPPDAPLVAYLPGSRWAELRYIWPPMAGAAQRISAAIPNARHAVGLARSLADRVGPDYFTSGADPQAGATAKAAQPQFVVTDRVYDLLNACDAVVTKSGTITLETTLFEKPMVIVYLASWLGRLEFYLWHHHRVRWIGMPNILANRDLCPELLGDQATPAAIAAQVIPWLRDPAAAMPVREGLREVRALLGEPGGVGRAAALALGLVSTPS